MTTSHFTSTVIVGPMALIAGVARAATMRGAARALPAMLFLSWPLAAAQAQTPCATTGTNQTCTNSVTISGGDGISDTATLILTNTATGAIRGTSFGGFGVVAGGTANVTNFGTIEATGANGVGIFANTVANVTNYGAIQATSANGIGIAADTANVFNFNMIQASARGISANTANVTNYGTIQAMGENGIGIAANTVANVTNFGTIQATGAVGSGIDAITANVWNSGTIAASNFGILAGTANVTNFGTIEATGVNGVAIATETGASVINRGTIQATGAGGTGIDVIGAANVVNAGTISGQRAALDFSSVADTLTLLPGSKIIGAITLRGGGDTVNFRGGNHNLTFDTLTGATVTGTTPFAVSDNRAAAIDPTSFAAGWRSLADFTRGVSDAVPVFSGGTPGGGAPLAFAGPESSFRIDDAFAAVPGLASAYAGEAMAFKAPTATHADGTTVWARGFAGQRIQQQDGVLLRNTNFFYGGMMGADFAFRPDLRVGGFLGGGQTRSRIDLNQGGSDSDLLFGGGYARYDIGASFLHGAVQGGSSRNSTTRTINNNLVANGLEIANASYNGWYVSPELTLGHRFGLGRLADATYTLTPSMRVRYLYGAFDGYTETGTTAPLTIGGQTVSVLEERGELKLTRSVAFDPSNQLSTSLAGGVLGTQRAGNTINAALLGQTIPFATPGAANVWGGFGGLGLEWRTRNVTFYSAAEYLALSDNSSVASGRAGLRVAF
jgi:hypothetical protein